jgi:hypothetical protein
MQALALLPTNADINQMLDSLLPETDGIAYDIATDAGDQVLDVASRRLDALRDLNVAAREYKVAERRAREPTRAHRNAFLGEEVRATSCGPCQPWGQLEHRGSSRGDEAEPLIAIVCEIARRRHPVAAPRSSI